MTQPYRPHWAPHVQASIGEPDPDDGEVRIDLACDECGTKAVAFCTSGQPRRHVSSFALAHQHGRDPFKSA